MVGSLPPSLFELRRTSRSAHPTNNLHRTTPETNPALRRGGFISFFRKQCASLPTYPGRAYVHAPHFLSPGRAALQGSSPSPLFSPKFLYSPPNRAIQASSELLRGS